MTKIAMASAALPGSATSTLLTISCSVILSSSGLFVAVTNSFKVDPIRIGTFADIAGASGENGVTGMTSPSVTGAQPGPPIPDCRSIPGLAGGRSFCSTWLLAASSLGYGVACSSLMRSGEICNSARRSSETFADVSGV